jgi:hypothetical protein
MGLVVYNPIAGGLLAGKHKPGQPAENTRFSNDKRYFDRYWSDENFEAVERLTQLRKKTTMSILELSMRWVVGQKGVTSVITGVSRREQLEQNLQSIKSGDLPAEILRACDAVWDSLAGTRFVITDKKGTPVFEIGVPFVENFRSDCAVCPCHEVDEVENLGGVAPLVVVPGNHFDKTIGQHDARFGVKSGRMAVTDEVTGDDGLFGVAEDPGIFPFAGFFITAQISA